MRNFAKSNFFEIFKQNENLGGYLFFRQKSVTEVSELKFLKGPVSYRLQKCQAVLEICLQHRERLFSGSVALSLLSLAAEFHTQQKYVRLKSFPPIQEVFYSALPVSHEALPVTVDDNPITFLQSSVVLKFFILHLSQ